MNLVTVTCARSALAALVYADALNRIDLKIEEWKATTTAAPNSRNWLAALDAGEADISLGNATLRLSTWLVELDPTDEDLDALAFLYPAQRPHDFPSPQTAYLTSLWATDASPVDTYRDFLRSVVSIETGAALDTFNANTNSAPDLSKEHVTK
jgi:hypothetical protein